MAGQGATVNRWIRMLRGQSVFHMQQCAGLYYQKGEVKGYYSDLRHKVDGAELIDGNGVPYNQTNTGHEIYFPISIFQYGLGAYDLYLETGDEQYKNRFMNVVNWAAENQQDDGAWNTFGWEDAADPYSSMGQGEGASLLCRAYVEEENAEYLDRALDAVRFMLRTKEEGGCARYDGGLMTLEENAEFKTILNGMIFSIWGLYDVCLLCKENDFVEKLELAVFSLEQLLPEYDRRFWSDYDLDQDIASPFYHDLHIEQLKVMYDLFGNKAYKETYERWISYRDSKIKPRRAFVVKAFQKLRQVNSETVIVK